MLVSKKQTMNEIFILLDTYLKYVYATTFSTLLKSIFACLQTFWCLKPSQQSRYLNTWMNLIVNCPFLLQGLNISKKSQVFFGHITQFEIFNSWWSKETKSKQRKDFRSFAFLWSFTNKALKAPLGRSPLKLNLIIR